MGGEGIQCGGREKRGKEKRWVQNLFILNKKAVFLPPPFSSPPSLLFFHSRALGNTSFFKLRVVVVRGGRWRVLWHSPFRSSLEERGRGGERFQFAACFFSQREREAFLFSSPPPSPPNFCLAFLRSSVRFARSFGRCSSISTTFYTQTK